MSGSDGVFAWRRISLDKETEILLVQRAKYAAILDSLFVAICGQKYEFDQKDWVERSEKGLKKEIEELDKQLKKLRRK